MHANPPKSSDTESPHPARVAYLGTWTWRQPKPDETSEDWLARTARLRARLMAEAAAWLTNGRSVRVHHGARITDDDITGQRGTVHRRCSGVFADHAFVLIEPTGRQRIERIRMLPLEIIEPVGDA